MLSWPVVQKRCNDGGPVHQRMVTNKCDHKGQRVSAACSTEGLVGSTRWPKCVNLPFHSLSSSRLRKDLDMIPSLLITELTLFPWPLLQPENNNNGNITLVWTSKTYYDFTHGILFGPHKCESQITKNYLVVN